MSLSVQNGFQFSDIFNRTNSWHCFDCNRFCFVQRMLSVASFAVAGDVFYPGYNMLHVSLLLLKVSIQDIAWFIICCCWWCYLSRLLLGAFMAAAVDAFRSVYCSVQWLVSLKFSIRAIAWRFIYCCQRCSPSRSLFSASLAVAVNVFYPDYSSMHILHLLMTISI